MSVETQEMRAAVVKATMLSEQHRELTALANPTPEQAAEIDRINDALRVKWDLEKGKAWLNGFVAEATTESVRQMLLSFARYGKGKTIELSINSWGGLAYEGVAIYNLIRDSEVSVNTRAIGKAYSAASLVFEAGAQRTIATGASLGVHRAWMMGIGNADELLHTAERLEGMDQRLMEIYTERGGDDNAEAIRAAVRKDTFLSAAEAVELGLADAVSRDKPAAAPKPKPAARKQTAEAAAPTDAEVELAIAGPADQPQAAKPAEVAKVNHKHHLAELGGLRF